MLSFEVLLYAILGYSTKDTSRAETSAFWQALADLAFLLFRNLLRAPTTACFAADLTEESDYGYHSRVFSLLCLLPTFLLASATIK